MRIFKASIVLMVMATTALKAEGSTITAESVFRLGPKGVCGMSEGLDTPLARLALAKGPVSIAPLGSLKPIRKSTHEGRRLSITEIRTVMPVGVKWHGLKLVAVETRLMHVSEGDAWSVDRLVFAETEREARRRLTNVMYTIPLAGDQKISKELLPPYGGRQRLISIGKHSALECSTDG